MDMMKRLVAGTALGVTAHRLLEKRDLKRLAGKSSELTGFKVNDLTARRLRDNLCAEGKTFVDVGAHIGSVIGAVRQSSRPGKIIAIEAIPEKVIDLRHRFPKADIIHCAVGDLDGEVEFTINTALSGCSSLDPAVRERADSFRVIRVQMKRLDDILPHSGIDLIKIDIEGAELGALRGGELVIAGSRPVIVFESGVHDMAGYSKVDLFRWFVDHDYEILAPIRVAHNAPPMTLDVFLDAHEYPRLTPDFFAIPRERRVEIRDRARPILGLG